MISNRGAERSWRLTGSTDHVGFWRLGVGWGGGLACGKPGLRVKDEREMEVQHNAGELEMYMRQQQKSPRGQEKRREG